MRDALQVAASIEASVNDVWRFLTTERASWWPEMRFEAAIGSPLIETWMEEGEHRQVAGVVTQCAEPRLLAFTWGEPDDEFSLDVSIHLACDGGATTVTITETGFVKATAPTALLDEHEEGWRYHLARWKRACESGSPE